MNVLKMTDVNLNQQRVLIREDFNVPIENGQISSDARLKAAIPTLKLAIAKGAAVIVLSHLGRPVEGIPDPQFSLALVAERLAELCSDIPVRFVAHNWLSGIEITAGEIVLCENVRFNKGEKENNLELAEKMAKLGDTFVMDAFATAHRAEASTYGIAKFAKVACAGPLLTAELNALSKAFKAPERPLVAIVGGSKVSTKLEVLASLMEKVDVLILGGGIANTFLAAKNYFIGSSLHEPDLITTAKQLLILAEEKKVTIGLPLDVVVAKNCVVDAITKIKLVHELEAGEMILDVGPKTRLQFDALLKQAKTIIWNGPVGVFELLPFSQGTKSLAYSIAQSSAYSLAGGGDTLAAIEKYQVKNNISYLSTGGGAFLEFLEGKKLPAISILEEKARACPESIHRREKTED